MPNSDSFTQQSNNLQLTSCLNYCRAETLSAPEQGHIFTYDFFAKSWDSMDVHPLELPVGEASKGMRKVTRPVLVLTSYASLTAFVFASEEMPVFFDSPFKKVNNQYIMLFELKPGILPEYIFYLSEYREITFEDAFDSDPFESVGTIISCDDGMSGITIKAEGQFFTYAHAVIPSFDVQRQRIAEAQSMEQDIKDRIARKERKLKQK